jgi:superfamily I DNA/RNA helicase
VVSGLAFPTITREEAGRRAVTRIAGSECILTADAIRESRGGLPDNDLRRALLAMLGPAQPLRPDEEKIKLLRGLLEPELVIAGSLKTGAAPLQEIIIFPPPRSGGDDEVRVLDIAQESCAKKLGGGHRVIRGVAGSGKTLILVYRARLLASHSRNKRYLFTCYTRTLAAALRAQLADCGNIDVGNLDRIMWDVIHAAGRVFTPSADGEYDPDETARIALPLLEKGFGPRYDGVLLDEAQDFGTDCLRFVLRLLKDPDGDLLIVSDAAQNIFGRKTVWRDAGIQAQGRTIVLKRNYRNTRQILDFADAFLRSGEGLFVSDGVEAIDEDAVVSPEAAVREGPAPRVIFASHFEEIVGETVKEVRAFLKRRSRARSVAVTYMTRTYLGRPLADDIRKALLGEGIDVFWMTDPARKDARTDLPSVNAPVILSTVHSLKGLEFPAVVMSTLVFPNMTPLENRKLIYVGMTRACNELVLIAQPGHPFAGILAGLAGG